MGIQTAPGDVTRTARPRVLCVDDEPNVLEGLRDMLHRSFDVRVAESGIAGLAMLRAEPNAFAIVISDMRMPGKSGDVFLREARTVAPDTVRLLLTGYADVDAAIRAVNQAHLFRFLTKPCQAEELLRACAAALGQHRLITGERVLLEQTLHGSIDALAGTLALANPAAFGRGGRVKALAGRLARAAELRNVWEVEVAAMLAHVGAVTLPQATVEKLYRGDTLTDDEQAMVDRVPAVTRRLLAKIPRLEGVLAILDSYHVTPEPGDFAALDAVPAGARVLRIAMDYDQLDFRGAADQVALGVLRSRAIYDRWLLNTFADLVGVGSGAPEVREVSLAQLSVGMTLVDDVLNAAGGLLVARGQAVTDQLIERLDNLTVIHVVREPLLVFTSRPDGEAS